jgi:hypothetical protein
VWLLAAVVALVCSRAEAAEPTPSEAPLEQAERLLGEVDYASAAQQVKKALDIGGLNRDESLRAYRLLAVTSVALKDDAAARRAFMTVLAMDPQSSIDPNLGPRFRDAHEDARAYWLSAPVKPAFDVSIESSPQTGASILVRVKNPLSIMKRVRVGHRWSHAAPFQIREFAAGDVTLPIEPSAAGGTVLDYFAEATDAHANVLFAEGSETAPRRAQLAPRTYVARTAPSSKSSVLSSPWFWGGALATVAASVTATVLLTRPATPNDALARPALSCAGAPCN